MDVKFVKKTVREATVQVFKFEQENYEYKLNLQVDDSIEIVENADDWSNVTVREETVPKDVPKDEVKDNKVKIK